MKPSIPLALLIVTSVTACASPFFSCDFEDASQVTAEWSAEGSAAGAATISAQRAASGAHSLSLVDTDPEKHAAWLSRPIDLSPEAQARGTLSLSWKELYAFGDKQFIRISILFLDGEGAKTPRHIARKGQSIGWEAGQFSEESRDIPIPGGTTKVRLKISSATSKGTEGEFYIDDLTLE